MVARPWSSSRLSCGDRLLLRCTGNTGNSFPITDGKPCPSPTPGACSNVWPSSWWCHPTISSTVVPFSSCLQSFPAWGSFQMSQFCALSGQNTGVSASASVLPTNIPLEFSGLISVQSKGLWRVFSSTTVWKHQFFWRQGRLCPVLVTDDKKWLAIWSYTLGQDAILRGVVCPEPHPVDGKAVEEHQLQRYSWQNNGPDAMYA